MRITDVVSRNFNIKANNTEFNPDVQWNSAEAGNAALKDESEAEQVSRMSTGPERPRGEA